MARRVTRSTSTSTVFSIACVNLSPRVPPQNTDEDVLQGRTFDVAEQVPFRLTTNIIDGMGVTGVEGLSPFFLSPRHRNADTHAHFRTSGVFRKAAEISLRILRDNQDSLMSVLETFVHDPLVEWNKKVRPSSRSSLPLPFSESEPSPFLSLIEHFKRAGGRPHPQNRQEEPRPHLEQAPRAASDVEPGVDGREGGQRRGASRATHPRGEELEEPRLDVCWMVSRFFFFFFFPVARPKQRPGWSANWDRSVHRCAWF